MKTFVKDYAKLWMETGRFCKNHWKGILITNAAVVGAEIIWFERDVIKGKIEDFRKKREAE